MIKLLKYRVLFITLLFGLFGGALSLLLKVDEMQTYYPALAMLIALCISLLISFLIKGKWNTSFRNKLKLTATILFIFFLISAAFHTYYFLNNTFKYAGFDGKEAYYVRGSIYTPAAIKCRQDHPAITSDAGMLEICFEGTEGKMQAWTEQSINNNIMTLIISYCTVILFFVAVVSLLTEILALKYDKSNKKLYKAKPVRHKVK